MVGTDDVLTGSTATSSTTTTGATDAGMADGTMAGTDDDMEDDDDGSRMNDDGGTDGIATATALKGFSAIYCTYPRVSTANKVCAMMVVVAVCVPV